MSIRVESFLWEADTSVASFRVGVKEQDRRFSAAMSRHHPELISRRPKPVVIRDVPHPKRGRPALHITKKPPKAVSTPEQLEDISKILRRPSVNKTVHEVAARHGLSALLVVSQSRERPVCAARNEVLHVLHQGGFSLMQLGRIFHKDHTTILHSIRRHKTATEAAKEMG